MGVYKYIADNKTKRYIDFNKNVMCTELFYALKEGDIDRDMCHQFVIEWYDEVTPYIEFIARNTQAFIDTIGDIYDLILKQDEFIVLMNGKSILEDELDPPFYLDSEWECIWERCTNDGKLFELNGDEFVDN